MSQVVCIIDVNGEGSTKIYDSTEDIGLTYLSGVCAGGATSTEEVRHACPADAGKDNDEDSVSDKLSVSKDPGKDIRLAYPAVVFKEASASKEPSKKNVRLAYPAVVVQNASGSNEPSKKNVRLAYPAVVVQNASGSKEPSKNNVRLAYPAVVCKNSSASKDTIYSIEETRHAYPAGVSDKPSVGKVPSKDIRLAYLAGNCKTPSASKKPSINDIRNACPSGSKPTASKALNTENVRLAYPTGVCKKPSASKDTSKEDTRHAYPPVVSNKPSVSKASNTENIRLAYSTSSSKPSKSSDIKEPSTENVTLAYPSAKAPNTICKTKNIKLAYPPGVSKKPCASKDPSEEVTRHAYPPGVSDEPSGPNNSIKEKSPTVGPKPKLTIVTVCQQCNKAYNDECAELGHKRRHLTQEVTGQKFQCDPCQQTFVSPISLQHHQTTDCPNYDPNLPSKRSLREAKSRGETLPIHIQNVMETILCEKTGTLKYRTESGTSLSPQIKKSFTCDLCKRKFKRKFNCIQHIERKICLRLLNTFKCDVCERVYKSKDTMERHFLNNYCKGKKKKILYPRTCEKCTDVFANSVNFHSHLRTCGRRKPQSKRQILLVTTDGNQDVRKFHFPDEAAFQKWKEEIELDTFSYFSSKVGKRKVKNKTYIYYSCQFHAPDVSHTKAGEPFRKTDKRYVKGCVPNLECTARMKVFVQEGGVDVTFYSTHNHPLSEDNVKFQPVKPSLRAELERQLLRGIPRHKILENVRKCRSEREVVKTKCVTMRYLSRVKYNLKRQGRLDPAQYDYISDDNEANVGNDNICDNMENENNCDIAETDKNCENVEGQGTDNDCDNVEDDCENVEEYFPDECNDAVDEILENGINCSSVLLSIPGQPVQVISIIPAVNVSSEAAPKLPDHDYAAICTMDMPEPVAECTVDMLQPVEESLPLEEVEMCKQCNKKFSKLCKFFGHEGEKVPKKKKDEPTRKVFVRNIPCDVCSRTFSNPKSLYVHRKRNVCHKIGPNISYPRKCDNCSESFDDSRTYHSHKRNCGKKRIKYKNAKCTYEGCEKTFYQKVFMLKHFEKEHNQQMEKHNLVFANMEEFGIWKEDMELKTYSYFSNKSGKAIKKNGDIYYRYFSCQFDVQQTSHRKKGVPFRKTEVRFKRGCVPNLGCPARIAVSVLKDKVKVTYYATHNHALEIDNVKYQRIKPSMQAKLKEQLSLGLKPREIVRKLKEQLEGEPLNKNSFLDANTVYKHKWRKKLMERKREQVSQPCELETEN